MIVGVADTHSALWYLFNDARLSVAAGTFLDQAGAAGSHIIISAISLAEIVYLVEKRRLTPEAYEEIKAALDDPGHMFKEAPLTAEIVNVMPQVERTQVPDMPDRIVAATAVYLKVPIVSRDGRIRASILRTIW